MEILHRNDLPHGGFAGVREHQLVKDPETFGSTANSGDSWAGIGDFIYMADARFVPNGETGMHSHREVDVISVIVEGRFAHSGSLGDGKELKTGQVQVQRAGGEGFSHNEMNPDNEGNRMIQLWVSPEEAGQAADYRLYSPEAGELTLVYGGAKNQMATLPSRTCISVGHLVTGQSINVNGSYLAYVVYGAGNANSHTVVEGDLFKEENGLLLEATDNLQFILIQRR